MEAMPYSEFVEWMALEQIEPFGDRRMDLHFALLRCQIANIVRPKDRQAYKVEEFMLNFDQPERPKQKPEQMLATMRMLAAASKKKPANA